MWVRRNVCCEPLCALCRAAGVTAPGLLSCLLGLYGKSHLLRCKEINQSVSAALLCRAALIAILNFSSTGKTDISLLVEHKK